MKYARNAQYIRQNEHAASSHLDTENIVVRITMMVKYRYRMAAEMVKTEITFIYYFFMMNYIIMIKRDIV